MRIHLVGKDGTRKERDAAQLSGNTRCGASRLILPGANAETVQTAGFIFFDTMNVEKPLTMIPTIKTFRAPFIALMTITMLVCSGCKPTGKKETVGSDNTTSQPRLDEVASSATAVTDSEAGGEPVRIDDDLSSVDWRSMLGQEVTITGELVVVDTYDLVRRGQGPLQWTPAQRPPRPGVGEANVSVAVSHLWVRFR